MTTQPNAKLQPLPMAAKEEEEEKTQAQLDYDEGLQLLKRGSFPQAAAAFHNALKGFEEEGSDSGIARSVTKLAEICLEKEDYAKALEHLERALAICRAAQDDLSTTYLQKRILQTLRGLERHEEARDLALELMAAYQDYNNPAGAVAMLENLGDIYLALGQPDKAAESLRTAAAIHRNFKHQRAAQQLLDRAEVILRQG